MSECGGQRDRTRADRGPKWVWGSTEASVERGAISVLACVEVAAGIGLYWWLIPWWLETNLHLLISVLVAALALYLENWLPVLTPFAEGVESHYFSRFPLLTWT